MCVESEIWLFSYILGEASTSDITNSLVGEVAVVDKGERFGRRDRGFPWYASRDGCIGWVWSLGKFLISVSANLPSAPVRLNYSILSPIFVKTRQ